MNEAVKSLREAPERTPFNLWRRETPGDAGWDKSAQAGAPNKYFMFSVDTHITEAADYLSEIEPQRRDRIPFTETRADGSRWLISEGNRPMRVKRAPEPAAAKNELSTVIPDAFNAIDDADTLRNTTGRTVEQRLSDHAADGVDAEMIFPNNGLMSWATPNPVFGLRFVEEYKLGSNFLWANDYPHHEGSWPHSAEAIERNMTRSPSRAPRPFSA